MFRPRVSSESIRTSPDTIRVPTWRHAHPSRAQQRPWSHQKSTGRGVHGDTWRAEQKHAWLDGSYTTRSWNSCPTRWPWAGCLTCRPPKLRAPVSCLAVNGDIHHPRKEVGLGPARVLPLLLHLLLSHRLCFCLSPSASPSLPGWPPSPPTLVCLTYELPLPVPMSVKLPPPQSPDQVSPCPQPPNPFYFSSSCVLTGLIPALTTGL